LYAGVRGQQQGELALTTTDESGGAARMGLRITVGTGRTLVVVAQGDEVLQPRSTA